MTDFVLLRGKGNWVRPYVINKYGKWSLDLYPDAESLEKFKAMKVKNHLKKDEDGYYFTLSRPPERNIRGKTVAVSPPIVLDKDNVPTSVPIGNGSDLTVKVEHYGYTSPLSKNREYACRLHSLRIDNLVPYTDSSRDDGEIKDVKDFKNVPIAFD